MVEDFIDRYKEKKGDPDLIIILSALWDINRWGPRFGKVVFVPFLLELFSVALSSTRRIARLFWKR